MSLSVARGRSRARGADDDDQHVCTSVCTMVDLVAA